MTTPDGTPTKSKLGRPDYHDDLIASQKSGDKEEWQPKGSRSDPVTGWRVWGVYRDESLLRGPFSAVPWRTTTASVLCSQHGEHTTAHPRCREGIYLFTNDYDAYLQAAICYTLAKQRVATAAGSSAWSFVIGSLTTTGITNLHYNDSLLLEGSEEWIAQKATIDKLLVLEDFCPHTNAGRLRDNLEKSLRIPVKGAASHPELAQLLDSVQGFVWTAAPPTPQQGYEPTTYQRFAGLSSPRSRGAPPIQSTSQWHTQRSTRWLRPGRS